MSGHSKWSTIKRQKEANDAKRGQLFSKLTRGISLAAKQGGPNPDSNITLRAVIDKARQFNMPKENIQRAIEKGSGGGAGSVEDVVYEGYGPGGVAIIVEAATDNKNRTAQEIKSVFERGGGSLASPGSVSFQFEKAGQILVEKNDKPDEQALSLMDIPGVEDVEIVGDGVEVDTRAGEIFKVKEEIGGAGMTVRSAELIFKPKVLVQVSDSTSGQRAIRLLEALDEHEDVQRVWANID